MTGPDEQAERRMVEAAQADPARFLDLYDRYFHRVYAYVARRTGNRSDAEDVTSEVFRRAMTNLQAFEWRGSPFGAWLFRIAANVMTDRWKGSARLVEGRATVEQEDEDDLEQRVLLYQLVERLPEAQRRVVELRFGEDKSLIEVATVLGKSVGAVKQLQRRAIEALRGALGDRA
ncbi:MAG: RNA polymerase sigma factor [Acidobacteriota bacterium]